MSRKQGRGCLRTLGGRRWRRGGMKKQPLPGGRERLRKTKHQFSIMPINLRAKKREIAKQMPSKVKNIRFDILYPSIFSL